MSRPPTAVEVPHLSVSERVARGKAARAEVPRSSNAVFEPVAHRVDPVELLEQESASRVAELVPIRYGRRLVSPFTFYAARPRSWPPIWQRRVARGRSCSAVATRTFRTSVRSRRPSGGWSSTSTVSTRRYPARGSGISSVTDPRLPTEAEVRRELTASTPAQTRSRRSNSPSARHAHHLSVAIPIVRARDVRLVEAIGREGRASRPGVPQPMRSKTCRRMSMRVRLHREPIEFKLRQAGGFQRSAARTRAAAGPNLSRGVEPAHAPSAHGLRGVEVLFWVPAPAVGAPFDWAGWVVAVVAVVAVGSSGSIVTIVDGW